MVVITFYTHGRIMMEHDDDHICCELLIPYLVTDDILIMNHKHVIIRNAICFSTNIQMPDVTLASTKYLCVGIKSCDYEMYSRCCR
jgi:hypothetical protein